MTCLLVPSTRARAQVTGTLFEIGPVLFPFTGYGTGGSHISTFELARALTDAFGVRTAIVAPAGSTIAAEAMRRDLTVITHTAGPKHHLFSREDFLQFFRRRADLKRGGNRTIVHCSDVWSIASWGLAARSAGVPIVYHNREIVRGRSSERAMIAQASAIISISQTCMKSLQSVNPPVNAEEILNPFEDRSGLVDRDEARTEFVNHWDRSDIELVGISGNFEHRKRQNFFLEAAVYTARLRPQARFVLFGRDRELSTINLAGLAKRLDIADKVLFAGFRSPPERNLKALDVLAAPALAEPFGRTLIESMLVGTPYVATDDAGHSEIYARFGGGVMVAREASPESFGIAMADALSRRDKYRLDEAQRSQTAAAISPVAHARKVYAIYERLFSPV